MPTYLNVGATQIQSWLGRSPDLKGRRGASSMLALGTDPAAWQDVPGARWNHEAGAVSGVVSLVVADGYDPADCARQALGRLRPLLPAAPLSASWATGSSYVEAYADMVAMRDMGLGLDSTPAVTENPLAKRCEKCALGVAAHLAKGLPDEEPVVCEDCRLRYAHAGHTNRRAERLAPLVDRLEETGTIPDDLGALAAVGAHRARDVATRVAVFYADGNAVGAFIKDAIGRGLPKERLVRIIDDANEKAFFAAADEVRACADGSSIHAVVPHVVAGDDVLVSVAGALAWPFATTYLSLFESKMLEGLEMLGGTSGLTLPSASGALVFHHRSSPLAEAIEAAARLLSYAKSQVDGSALTFLDLMSDDPTSEPLVAARPRGWVVDALETASAAAALPSSHRKRMVPYARRALASSGSGAREELTKIVDRSGHAHLKALVDGDDVEGLIWTLQIATDVRPKESSGE